MNNIIYNKVNKKENSLPYTRESKKLADYPSIKVKAEASSLKEKEEFIYIFYYFLFFMFNYWQKS